MRRSFLSLAALSFSLSAGFGYLTSSCDPMCDCEEGPLEPEAVGPWPVEEASMEDPEAEAPVDPRGGSMKVERERVVVSYERDGKKHEIVYAVVGKP